MYIYIRILYIYNLYNGKPPALGRCSSAKPLSRAKYDVRGGDGERVSERDGTTGRGRRREKNAPSTRRRRRRTGTRRTTTGWSLRALDFII